MIDTDMTVPWHKSTASTPTGNCVEVGEFADGTIGVRNTRAPGAVQKYTRGEWDAFLVGVKRGEF
jgi:hypothetical protein